MRPCALIPRPRVWVLGGIDRQVQIRELAVAIQSKTVDIHGMQAGLRAELVSSTRAIQRCIVSVAERWGPPLLSARGPSGYRAVALSPAALT